MYGTLKVVAGPMFSGKTSYLIREALWFKHNDFKFGLYKPSFDTRWHKEKITTHNGITIEATCISDLNQVDSSLDTFLFDEIQFFDQEGMQGDLVSKVKEILSSGKNVVACGLDMDWKGDPFLITAKLLAMADTVEKIQSVCNHSGLPATKTFKKPENREGNASVEIGDKNIYEARNNLYYY